MSARSDVTYVYDGSFEGLLTAVFESFESRELPCSIVAEDEFVPTLFACKTVDTDPQKADRVRRGLKNVSADVWNAVRLGYLTYVEDRGTLINDFVHMVMHYGAGVMRMLADDTVSRLTKAVRALKQESHKYTGFVRFSISEDNILTSIIEPKNFVLPLLAPHFCDRYPNESFLIYDKTHSQALVWHNRQKMIIPLDGFEQPQAGDEELYFCALWKHFYDTVAIEARYNPRCRMNFMPKRYWNQLPEMDESNSPDAVRGVKRIGA